MPSTARTATKGLARLYSAENKPRFGGFEAFEHTHGGIVATGDSPAEALSWAAIGIFSIIDDLEIVQFKSEIKVSVSSANSEALVVDWLNKLLFRVLCRWFPALKVTRTRRHRRHVPVSKMPR